MRRQERGVRGEGSGKLRSLFSTGEDNLNERSRGGYTGRCGERAAPSMAHTLVPLPPYSPLLLLVMAGFPEAGERESLGENRGLGGSGEASRWRAGQEASV